MPIFKKKVSIAWYIMLFGLLGGIIAAVVLHVVGIWDLSFIAEGFMGYVSWQAADAMNAVIGAVVWIALGGIIVYILKTYIFGTVIGGTGVLPYNPLTPNLSSQQQDETVVSD